MWFFLQANLGRGAKRQGDHRMSRLAQMRPNDHCRLECARPAFTLVEAVLSLIITSILCLAIGSALTVASRALPQNDSPASAGLTGAFAIEQLSSDLIAALCIAERSATTLAFTVPDRNGDGSPERIRYAWSGTIGDPLTREYNGT